MADAWHTPVHHACLSLMTKLVRLVIFIPPQFSSGFYRISPRLSTLSRDALLFSLPMVYGLGTVPSPQIDP